MDVNIAFVTGYVGRKLMPNIPKKPKGYDSYYITNHPRLYKKLQKTDWTPIFIENIIDIIALFSPQSHFLKMSLKEIKGFNKMKRKQFYALASKRLKVYPNLFLPKTYDFIIWSDNKFDVNALDSIKTIKNWDNQTAMKLHKHPFVDDSLEEFEEAMKQARYNDQRASYEKYLNGQVNKGLSAKGAIHYQTGYLIYNESHPKTNLIRATWQEHINMCGINCQISFHFITQLFNECIDEYVYPISPIKEKSTFLSFFKKKK